MNITLSEGEAFFSLVILTGWFMYYSIKELEK